MDKLKIISECYSCGAECVTKKEKARGWRCPVCVAKPKLQFHYSLDHASKVLKIVQDELDDRAPAEFEGTIGAWSNCREQGYYLERDDLTDADKRPALVFAQIRNSDGIVVIAGQGSDFCLQQHKPSDEIWEKGRVHFYSDLEAAQFIVKHLLGKE